MNNRNADVIVIGAGHNGLVCAGYLAKAGLDVLVLERSNRIGGACVSEELTPGYIFSTFAYSAHGPGPKICGDLEIPANAFTIVPTDPGMFLPFPDGDHCILWADREKTARDLERIGPREGQGYLAYHQFLESANHVMQSIFLEPPPTHQALYDRFAGTPYEVALEAMLTRSHWDVICDYFETEKVRCAMARSDDVGYPTAVGSLLADVIENASEGAGVENISGLPDGGMGVITAALAAAVCRYGAEIRTESAVERVLIKNGRATGVRLSGGETLTARMVVSNADPKRTFLKLIDPHELDNGFRETVTRIKTRANYMKYHAVITAAPPFTAIPPELADDPRLLASVRISPSLSYMENAWLDAQQGIPSRQPVMSLQLPTAYLPHMAKPGKHIFGAWVRYGPPEPKMSNDALRDESLKNIIATLESYAPGFSDLIEWQRLYTNFDIENETGITNASIRHVDMTLDQMLYRRPLPSWSAYKSPIEGLWMCGSGTHPCGSVTGAPGHNAAHAILSEHGMG